MTQSSVGTLPAPNADDIQTYIADVTGELSTLAGKAGLDDVALLLEATSRVVTPR